MITGAVRLHLVDKPKPLLGKRKWQGAILWPRLEHWSCDLCWRRLDRLGLLQKAENIGLAGLDLLNQHGR